ncbi:hypothetical protein EPUS_05379 [Endocarpon pusillum Z07020]|uniref:Uncharacterized protein n=1 Tax=Endocarpon pusillum (strain Z07020 / HMAS-L-300199) TaxID=1263415 RepID=U1GPR1_ENDPU|nr:uncharacterized protein EPUS_05379 [Endocarpon pusillum Z07020]ERF73956.1 hypothetical protein EPUS_05379 [Endocarpon pusillum Z07020]
MASSRPSGAFEGSPPPEMIEDNPSRDPISISDHPFRAILSGPLDRDRSGRRQYVSFNSDYTSPNLLNLDTRLPPHQETTTQYQPVEGQSLVQTWDFPSHSPYHHPLVNLPRFSTVTQPQSPQDWLLLPPVLAYDHITARSIHEQNTPAYDSHRYIAPSYTLADFNGTGYGMLGHSAPDYGAVASFGLSGHRITGSTSAEWRSPPSRPPPYQNSQHSSPRRPTQNTGFLLQSTAPFNFNVAQPDSPRQQESAHDGGPAVTYVFDSNPAGAGSPWSFSTTGTYHHDPRHSRRGQFN